MNAPLTRQALAEAGAGTRVGVLGWSEGGGMALAVPELPDAARLGLDVRAVATFAPGVPGLALRTAGLGGNIVASEGPDPHTLMLFAVQGWLHDDLDPLDVLTPAGLGLIEAEWNRRTCLELGALAIEVEARQGPLFRSDPVNTERWIERMLETSAGRVRATAPVWIATGSTDATVPPAWQRAYFAAATALGTDVTQVEYEGEDHCGVVFAACDAACRRRYSASHSGRSSSTMPTTRVEAAPGAAAAEGPAGAGARRADISAPAPSAAAAKAKAGHEEVDMMRKTGLGLGGAGRYPNRGR